MVKDRGFLVLALMVLYVVVLGFEEVSLSGLVDVCG